MNDQESPDVTQPKQVRATFDQVKRNILIYLVMYSAFLGIADCFVTGKGSTYLVAFPWWFLVYAWCVTDANQRGFRLRTPMKLALIWWMTLGVPVYLFRTRGLRAFLSLALVLGLLLVLLMVASVTSIATFTIVNELISNTNRYDVGY